MKSHELISVYLFINLCINQIQMLRNSITADFQCVGNVPTFLVNKVPVVVVLNAMIPQYRSLKHLGKYSLCHRRHEIKTCNYCLPAVYPRLFNIARKMLVDYLQKPLVKKASHIAVVFPMISPGLVGAAHASNKEAADKQAWSLLLTRTSVLHASSLHASTQDSPCAYVFLHLSEWAGNARARWSLAHTT